MGKIFLVNPTIESIGKQNVQRIETDKIGFLANQWDKREQLADKAMHEECKLKYVQGRVIVRINEESKNVHTFANGTVIRRERKFNNFNFREVNPSNGIIVSAEKIPVGSEVLYDYTSLHDSNKIFGYKSVSPDVSYYSFKEDEIYAWKDENGEYKPAPNYEFGLRCYQPYKGALVGIQPKFLKDILLVTTGSLKGKVVRTLKGCDYMIVFTDDKGQEGNLIRFRHSDNPDYDREEIICIADDLTEEYGNGNLLVGISPNDAKSIFEL